jgi:hypothetical protein
MFSVLFEWKPIDMANAIVVPVVLMLTLGAALAIYTGLIATRVFAFFQLRARAVAWVFELRDVLIEEHETPHDFSMKLGHATQGIILEFRSLGHSKADALIGSIFSAYLEKMAQACSVPMPPGGVAGSLSPLLQIASPERHVTPRASDLKTDDKLVA